MEGSGRRSSRSAQGSMRTGDMFMRTGGGGPPSAASPSTPGPGSVFPTAARVSRIVQQQVGVLRPEPEARDVSVSARETCQELERTQPEGNELSERSEGSGSGRLPCHDEELIEPRSVPSDPDSRRVVACAGLAMHLREPP